MSDTELTPDFFCATQSYWLNKDMWKKKPEFMFWCMSNERNALRWNSINLFFVTIRPLLESHENANIKSKP